MNRLYPLTSLTVLMLVACGAAQARTLTETTLTVPVDLDGDGAANALARVDVLDTGDTSDCALTMVAVHGFMHNGDILDPLAAALAADDSVPLGRLYAIHLLRADAVGLDEEEMLFGELSLDDFVVQIEQILDFLVGPTGPEQSIDVFIGHSMGGQLAFMRQQKLIDADDSAAQRWGTKLDLLISPVPPQSVSWHYQPISPALLKGFEQSSEDLGTYYEGPDALFRMMFFGSRTGNPVPNAPSVTEVRRVVAEVEAGNAAEQMIGTAEYKRRPDTAYGLYQDSGTAVEVMAANADFWFLTGEMDATAQHISGSIDARAYVLHQDNSGATVQVPHDGLYIDERAYASGIKNLLIKVGLID